MSLTIETKEFGSVPETGTATLYTLRNANGVSVALTNYGGIITSVRTPDRSGNSGEITLAYDELDRYLAGHPFFGAFVGRFANRIAEGRFTIDGTTYQLAQNKGSVHLHGGVRGFDKYIWNAREFNEPDRVGVVLSRTSPDGEEGYPGNLTARITVSLNEEDELAFEYVAETDRPTPVNLTNHTYWNLGSDETILKHRVRLYCDAVLEVNDRGIPTGTIVPVESGPFDFHQWKTIAEDFEDVRRTPMGGYDHCLRIQGWNEDASRRLLPVADVFEPASGRTMSVRSTMPGVQFYTGNNLPGAKGRDGKILKGQEAFCLETQFFPDSVNHPEFPDTILRPGQQYYHVTVHSFGVRP